VTECMSRFFNTAGRRSPSLAAMSHLSTAAAAMTEIVRGIEPDQLTNATPCTEYDVRALVNHLLFWGPSLEAAGRKEITPPPAAAESDVDLTGGDWASTLTTQLDSMAATWSAPEAWEGATRIVGPTETPAAVIGSMIVGELVVHSWDLATATGQELTLDDELLAYLHEQVTAGAEQGRRMGVYGPEVPVPASAPTLDRILGLTGRDPAWSGTVTA
jgi:uncharacterized protein (TIGR03086 family)